MNNNHSVDGRIGAKGAELGTTKGGKQFIKFSLANNSFSGGQEETVWYDVTCYDPFIIENKLEKLKKGVPVMVYGTLKVDHNVRDNKVWINMNLTAYRIDIMGGNGNQQDQTNETQQASTYTGGTQSEKIAPQPKQEPVTVTEPETYSTGSFSDGSDDLPF